MSSKKKNKTAAKPPKIQEKPTVKKQFLDVYYPKEFMPKDLPKVSSNPLWLILCFLVPFVFLGVCFYLNKVTPFGDRTIFYGDFKAQYYPFLQEMHSKLQNGGSLLWTWDSGLGSNFIGMIGYYLSSPMYLLLTFVPEKYLIVGVNVCMMAKFGLCGLTTGIFLKKVFRRNDISILAFSLCYAFSNFMMGYHWNILWLDTVALLPLVALGIYKLVYERKFMLYVITLALSVISNYYIGYMLCLFTLFWFFILWLKYPKQHRTTKGFLTSLFSIGGFSALALSMSAFLVVPVLFQLQNSASTNATGLKKAEFFHSFFEILGNWIGFHGATKIEEDGLPNIYCGMICIVLFIIFARCQKISLWEKITDLCFVGFIFFSLNWSPLDFMWHGFHEPNQIPSRFAFIFIFVLIILSFRAFTLIKYVKGIDIAISACFVAFVLICAYAYKINILWSAVLAAVYLVLIWLYELKVFDLKVLTPIISIIIIGEMCYNCYYGAKFIGTSDINYPKENASVSKLINEVKDEEYDDFFRMEQTYLSSKNDGMWYQYHAMGQFSSTSSKNVVNMTSKIGMISLKLSFQTYHTSPIIASMLNLKYYIARNSGYIADDPTLTSYKQDGSTTLYKYNYYLPLGFMTDKDFDKYSPDTYSADPVLNQNELFKAATGITDDVYTEIYAKQFGIDGGDLKASNLEEGKFDYNCSSKGKNVTMKYVADKDGEYYCFANLRDDAKNLTVKSSSIDHQYDVESKRYLMPIGNYKAGDNITISFSLTEAQKGNFRIIVAHFDEDKFKSGYEKLNDETMKISSYTDTTVDGTITANEDGIFYTSIPDEKGWKLYVDGVEVEKSLLIGSFIGAPVTKGEHTIHLEYFPEGLKLGIVISVVALLIFVAICVFVALKNKREKAQVNSENEGE